MPDGNGYIIAAYVVTWVAIIGYAVRLHFVMQRARAQLEQASRSDAGGAS